MISQSPKLDQLQADTPLLFHPNALAYVLDYHNKKKLPTQIVYPDTSIAIGLSANPLELLQRGPQETSDDDSDDDVPNNEGAGGLLLIHASKSPDEIIKVHQYPYYLKIIICSIVQIFLLFIITGFSIVQKSYFARFYWYFLILALDLPIWWLMNNRKILLIQTWIFCVELIALYLLFTSLYSFLELLFLSGIFFKIYWVQKMINQVMPHIFTLSGVSN